eukprot:gene22531-23721_t
MRDRKKGLVVEYDLSLLSDVTPYPYRLQCEQHKLVRILLEKLETFDHVDVVWGCAVANVSQTADRVDVVLEDGRRYEADYVIGADGGRSVVRKSQDIGFE